MRRRQFKICYLSTTVTNKGHHLAFCGQTYTYGEDRERYRVANYADPTEVTCQNCLIWWERTYPDRAKEFYARWPKPTPYVTQAGEHPDVHLLREAHAGLIRTYVRMYGADEDIPDVDFAYGLHQFTYELAKELAKFALKLHALEGEQ